MTKKATLLPLVVSYFLSISCASTQEVQIPPVTIHANAPDAQVYRASYPIKMQIEHTELNLHFDWEKAYVFGKANLTLSPYFYPQDSVILDANGFEIHQVLLLNTGEKLDFQYDGKKLKIALDRLYKRNEAVQLFINYTAKPNDLVVGKDIASPDDRGLYFIQPGGEEQLPRQLWSQGETECNSNWFPTINNTMLKMTQKVTMTVPDSMVTLSNGLLKKKVKNKDGSRTDTWEQDKPHAPYLTMIAAGNFQITKDSWQNKEVSYYLEPQYAPYARMIFGKTPQMLSFFSEKLGVDFPWDKYAQIVVRKFVSGAMENTSATVFFDRMNRSPAAYKDETYEDIIAHELFHHWFGDLVTAESWANLPLNESFATYGEYLWLEHQYGREEADMHAWNDLQTYLGEERNTEKDVIRFDYADREQMFDAVSYQKGGRILHMLRKTVGDDAFFASLQLYLKRHAFQSAEIHDLRLAFEDITGWDLNWFFNQWFLSAGHPVLTVQTHYNDSLKQAVVQLEQNQDRNEYPLYRLPMQVDIYVGDSVQRQNVVLTKATETFCFNVEEAPKLINVDADHELLARIQENKSMDEYLFQYRHAPLFVDRMKAVEGLSSYLENAAAGDALLQALEDKSWMIRLTALGRINQMTAVHQQKAYVKVKEMVLNDKRSYVRAMAIALLKTTYKHKDNQEVFAKAAQDDAPSVQQALISSYQ